MPVSPVHSLGKAAGKGGANFISSLHELKKMQENYSHLKIELETRFAQDFLDSEVSRVSGDTSPPTFALFRVLMFEFLLCLI